MGHSAGLSHGRRSGKRLRVQYRQPQTDDEWSDRQRNHIEGRRQPHSVTLAMAAREVIIRQWLEKEAEAWRDLPPREYDRALCAILEEIANRVDSSDGVDALLALTSATLRRDNPVLVESRACSA